MAKINALTLLNGGNSLTAYLGQINKLPMLTQENEYMLAKRFKEHGDIDAAHELTVSHLRLAAKVAISYRHYGLPLADLVSEANIGLMQAIKKFDPDKGFRLATYALWWIKAAVAEYVLKSWSLVKIGTVASQKRLFYNLHKIKARLGLYNGASLDNETAGKIAKMLSVQTKDVVEMEQRLSGDSSLNAPLSDDSVTCRQDMLADGDETIEEVIVEKQDLDVKRKMLKDAMSGLKDRERIIIEKRFLSDDPTTLEDLAIEFNISRERVRQIEAAAYEKIKKSVQAAATKLTI